MHCATDCFYFLLAKAFNLDLILPFPLFFRTVLPLRLTSVPTNALVSTRFLLRASTTNGFPTQRVNLRKVQLFTVRANIISNPSSSVANPCELHCRPKGRQFYVRQSRKVIDGTRCQAADPGHICVEGVCVELGCDRSLGSGATEDRCRVCGGDGRTCRTVASVFAGSSGLVSGYNDVLLVPAGATNIMIRETVPTNNYLAIRAAGSSGGGRFYLNGDWHIAQPQSLSFAGTKWEYSKQTASADGRQAETLTAKGPTSEALLVVLLFQEENQGISYEYSVPFTVQHSPASGDSLPPPRHSQQGPVPPPSPAPTQPGQYVWIFGDYSPCSRNCGTGIQRRKVLCATVNPATGLQETAAEALCDVTTRPSDSRPCFNPDTPTCPPAWFAGNWSACSCVTRQQMRPVFCTSGSPTEAAELGGSGLSGGCPMLPDDHCSDEVAGARPAATKACEPKSCPVWIAGNWTECDVGRCGEGRHNRTVRCGILPAKKGEKPQRKAKLEVKSFEDDPADQVQISMQRKREVDEQQTEASLLTVTTESAAAVLSLSVDAANTEATLLTDTSEKKVEAVVAQESKEEEEKEEEVVYVDSWLCDPATKPKAVDRCFKAPCDEAGSVEWITSAWSSCDADCGPAITTRKVLCSTRDGTVFGDDICVGLRGPKPEEKKACSERSCSKSLWFIGEWSACSAKCGKGKVILGFICVHFFTKNF